MNLKTFIPQAEIKKQLQKLKDVLKIKNCHRNCGNATQLWPLNLYGIVKYLTRTQKM